MRLISFLILFLHFVITIIAQENNSKNQIIPLSKLDSSNLPIVIINTNLQSIPDTIKIPGTMGIINNGYNKMNYVKDPQNDYKGNIGIEKRGSISQLWPQKSYGIETRNAQGNDTNVKILSMPKEHDWILYGPHDDKTLLKNALTYSLSRKMGYWAPRTKHCEVSFVSIFNILDYQGTYVMMEKIKRDNDRVNISKLDNDDNAGDSLTGGYIIAVDGNIWSPDSGFYSQQQAGLFIEFKYPKGSDITPQQEAYIQAYVDSFELALKSAQFANPINGYRKFIDEFSFIDFFIMQELSKNLDSYRRSSYLYKDKKSKGGKLIAGPLWDFNSAWGAPQLCNFEKDTGWAYLQTCWIHSNYPIPFWWDRFMQDSNFVNNLNCRWHYWRSNVLDTNNIFREIDSMRVYLSDASVRHYDEFTFTNFNFNNQVDSLKGWIRNRIAWLDANMPGNCKSIGINEAPLVGFSLFAFPNPTYNFFTLQINSEFNQKLEFELTDFTGRIVYKEIISVIAGQSLNKELSTKVLGLNSGIYMLKLSGQNGTLVQKIMAAE